MDDCPAGEEMIPVAKREIHGRPTPNPMNSRIFEMRSAMRESDEVVCDVDVDDDVEFSATILFVLLLSQCYCLYVCLFFFSSICVSFYCIQYCKRK